MIQPDQIYQSRADASTLVRVVHAGSRCVFFALTDSLAESCRTLVLSLDVFVQCFDRCARVGV